MEGVGSSCSQRRKILAYVHTHSFIPQDSPNYNLVVLTHFQAAVECKIQKLLPYATRAGSMGFPTDEGSLLPVGWWPSGPVW